MRLVRNSTPQYWRGSGWGFSKSLERETPFFEHDIFVLQVRELSKPQVIDVAAVAQPSGIMG